MATQTVTIATTADSSVAIPYTATNPKSSHDIPSSATLCTSPSCPITNAHPRGIYTPVSRDKMSPKAHRMFSPSIPPPHVLAAFERCLHEGMSTADVKIWVGFHESHTEPLIQSTDLRWVTPVSAAHIDEYLNNNDSCQNDRDSLTETKNYVARHPFGLNNPPDDVWASHARLQRGERDRRHPHLEERDREIVGAFSADKGFCAEGVGAQVSSGKRFKVRRLSFVRQLAEIRKQKRGVSAVVG